MLVVTRLFFPMLRNSAVLASVAVFLTVPASAQPTREVQDSGTSAAWEADTVPATVTGVVYDSTRARTLAGARVAVIGTAISGVTDSAGAYRLEGIPPGDYSLTFHHSRIQELGVSPGSPMVRLQEGAEVRVDLAIPSRETILKGWCALEGGRLGTAHVGGVVRDSLTQVPLPNARVELDLASAQGGSRIRLETRTDAEGRYRFCNVGGDRWLNLSVSFGNQKLEGAAVRPASGEALIHDFTLRLSHEVRITGRVVDRESLAPIEGAHVDVLGTSADALTDEEGRFGFAGLPPGRHVLVSEFLGYQERIDTLTVFSREALGVEVRLSTEPIALDPLVVLGRSRTDAMPWTELGTRVDGLTRSQIEKIVPRVQTMAELLRNANIPGLNVREVTFKDDGFYLDGLCVEVSRARRLAPETCAMVTVYLNGVRLPSPEYTLQDFNHRTVERFQLLSPVEAAGIYGREGRNGVLLIETR